MSGPAYVVMPVQGGGAQDGEKISMALQEALQQNSGKTQQGDHVRDGQHSYGHGQDGKQPQRGPLKEIMAQQDSLYKYINWEDPFRTLGSYVLALSILLGAHYLPLTQWVLKVGATAFGVMSATEFASRQFGPNTFLSRLRPKEYKKIPESTLNATLHDIHDFVQYAAVQVQRTIFAEDLQNTFVAFMGLTALYWLIQVMSPFGLAVVGLTSLYIAPLVTSARGREVARDARVRAGELANAASENGKALAQDGRAKAAELSSKTRDAVTGTAQNAKQTAADMSNRAGDMAQNAKHTAANMSNRASDTITGTAQNAKHTAADLSNRAGDAATGTAQNAKHTAADLSNRASDTASDLSGAATEKSRHLQQTGANSFNQASDATNSTSAGAKQSYNNSPYPSAYDGHDYGSRFAADTTGTQLPHVPNGRIATGREIGPDGALYSTNLAQPRQQY